MDCTIYKKIAEVRKEIKEWMSKGWKNKEMWYSYFSDDQISEKFRNLFDEHGICFVYSSEITGCREISPTRSWTKQFVTDVLVNYKFVDIDTWSMIEWTACWSWNDTGDKWVYKAITGAVKYIFMKTFQISTGDDPEKDDVKERKPKTEKKETEDMPFTWKKPIFDEITRGTFKQSVETWKMECNDETLKKIQDKFDVSPRRAMEIQWFILKNKQKWNDLWTSPEK